MTESLLAPAFLSRLERLDFIARRIFSGEYRGDVRTRRRGAGALFREHKRYTQGDDLRFLDWNVYSRLGELLIKEFEAEENLRILLLVDASGSMGYGSVEKLQVAKQISAALGYIALNRFAAVDVAILPRPSAGRGRRVYRGRAGVAGLFATLEEATSGGEVHLFDELRTATKSGGRGLAILVSDFFAEGGYARGLQFLQHLGYRVAAVHVLDRMDLRPEVAGRVRLVDIESSRSVRRVVSKAMLEAYETEARAWCDAVSRFCRSHGISYARVDTAWSLERIVTNLLLKGGLLR